MTPIRVFLCPFRHPLPPRTAEEACYRSLATLKITKMKINSGEKSAEAITPPSASVTSQRLSIKGKCHSRSWQSKTLAPFLSVLKTGITIAIVRTAAQSKWNHPLNKTQKSPLLVFPVRQIKHGHVNAVFSPILQLSLVLWFSFFYRNHLSVSARCIWIEFETLVQINKLSFSCNSFVLIGSRAGVRRAGGSGSVRWRWETPGGCRDPLMKTSQQTPFPSIRPVLMSFHADQIQAEMAFCSSGQFSLHGPDKSRHCTITSHKSVSVPHCAEWMNYWTGAGEKDIHTHTNTFAGTFAHTHPQSSRAGLITWWASGWCWVLMWTSETVSCLLLYQGSDYDVWLPEERKQCLSRGVKPNMGKLASLSFIV